MSLRSFIGIRTLLGVFEGDAIIGSSGNDSLHGTDGDDRINGMGGDDTLSGFLGNDTLIGGKGRDIIQPGSGRDVVNGGAGVDYLDFNHMFGLTVSLAKQGQWQNTGFGSLFATGIEAVFGEGGDDRITGDAQNNRLSTGDGGNDTLNGADGDDFLEIQASGNPENKLIIGGAGVDTLSIYASDQSPIVLNLREKGEQSTAAGYITLRSVENLSILYSGDDILIGDRHDNVLAAHTGSDLLIGGKGDDTLLGDGSILVQDGGDAIYTTLAHWSSTDGSDTLRGGAGNDVLIGGIGDDYLVGGKGADTFGFSPGPQFSDFSTDTIADLSDEDTIDLSEIDAKVNKAGNQAFHLVEAFSGHAGELVVTYVASEHATHFLLDVDGDGAADMTIVAKGDHSAFESFVL